MRDVRCTVEKCVDAMSTVRLHGAAVFALRVLLNHSTIILESRAGLRNLNRFVKAFSGCLDYAHRVRIGERLVANIIGFVDVSVISTVVESNVDIDNVTILEDALVRDAVADTLVHRRADGFGEVAVVER